MLAQTEWLISITPPYRASEEVKKIFSLDFMRKVVVPVCHKAAQRSLSLSAATTQKDEGSWNDTAATEQVR